MFPSEASCRWNVTGYCQSSVKMEKCNSEALTLFRFMLTLLVSAVELLCFNVRQQFSNSLGLVLPALLQKNLRIPLRLEAVQGNGSEGFMDVITFSSFCSSFQIPASLHA